MRDFLALPATLLALIAAASTINAHDQQSRPADFSPEHQTHLKRERQAQEQLQWQQPVGMRKMTSDEGEKFFLHYWDFGDPTVDSRDLEDYVEGARRYANTSMQLSAPLASHFERAHTHRRFPGYGLFARDWGSCPSGTKSCTEIGAPDSCCSESDTCIKVDDTGNGDVGCCPEGGSCGSSISDCDESAGQTSCPESANKGCCIEGYACYDVGCVWASTLTTTTNLPVATVTQGRTSEEPSTTTSEQETDTVAVAGGAGGSTYTTTVENTVTETAPGTTSIGTLTAPTTVTVTASPSETSEEPTETEGEPSSTTSTEETAALPPARPTGTSESSAPESVTTTTPEPTTETDDSCPTGFYMCSAHYLGGCCRVGRNCDTTSCPTSDSTAIVSNGVTIGGAGGDIAASTSTTTVDADASSTTASSQNSDTCANGWFLCGESEGGGCCPSNYVCGASCTATVSGVDNQAKQEPSGAEVVKWAWGFFGVALGTGIGMVWL